MSNNDVVFLLSILFYLAFFVVWIVAWCFMTKRLGYTPMAGLLLLIPVVGFICFLCWAFTESPNERKIRRLLCNRDERASNFLSTAEIEDNSPEAFLSQLGESW